VRGGIGGGGGGVGGGGERGGGAGGIGGGGRGGGVVLELQAVLAFPQANGERDGSGFWLLDGAVVSLLGAPRAWGGGAGA